MAELEFRDLSFSEMEDFVRVHFLKIFYFDLKREELENIASSKISKHKIIFECSEKRANTKFYNLLLKGFQNLKNSINNRKAVYIHRNSGIPLIGSNVFGIVDRNTSCIEVKPITGCNLNCMFCSVDEGAAGKKETDFVIEEEYLADEFRKIAEFKGQDIDIEAHLNAHGEPLLYSRIIDLVRDIAQIKNVKTISIDTNGTMLSEELCNNLVKAGLTRFNISISAISPEKARQLGNCKYDSGRVLEMAEYASKIADVIITPVWVPGFNDDEIPKIIDFANRIRNRQQKTPYLGIQNFLNYPHGRNPVKGIPMNDFKSKLSQMEKKYKVKLLLTKEDFGIAATKKLPKPFKKRDVISAEIKCGGRLKNEKIAAAQDRNITMLNCKKESGRTRIKIIRSKHNIFLAKEV